MHISYVAPMQVYVSLCAYAHQSDGPSPNAHVRVQIGICPCRYINARAPERYPSSGMYVSTYIYPSSAYSYVILVNNWAYVHVRIYLYKRTSRCMSIYVCIYIHT